MNEWVCESADEVVDYGLVTTKEIGVHYGLPVVVVLDKFVFEEVDEGALVS